MNDDYRALHILLIEPLGIETKNHKMIPSRNLILLIEPLGIETSYTAPKSRGSTYF